MKRNFAVAPAFIVEKISEKVHYLQKTEPALVHKEGNIRYAVGTIATQMPSHEISHHSTQLFYEMHSIVGNEEVKSWF
jgi:hypothetical protein